MSAAASTLSMADVQSRIAATQKGYSRLHLTMLAFAACAWITGALAWAWQIRHGMVATGLDRPVSWGVFIVDFVFWVGIAHSGTLISAVLYLFRARFRTAVYRAAEAMTVFGVMTAGLFPVIHLGRPWLCYWLFPLPNQRHLWINFRSPLVWDVFAVSVYFLVSSTFLFVGMVPDAAALRDASTGWRRRLYAFLAFGWRGTVDEWRHYVRAYLFLAAFATPLVFSVHSVVAWDFAVSILPGWHSSLFPPYFVAGAIFSGVAMVMVLLIPLRKALGLESMITPHHLDMLSRIVLLTSLIVTYSYVTEMLMALSGPPTAERETLLWRATGSYWPLFWLMVTCNCIVPLALFAKKVRASTQALTAIGIAVVVGMWLERFMIVVGSLSHDRDPFIRHNYVPGPVEILITIGSFGWFFFWFLLFIRLLPAVSIAEMKEEALAHA